MKADVFVTSLPINIARIADQERPETLGPDDQLPDSAYTNYSPFCLVARVLSIGAG